MRLLGRRKFAASLLLFSLMCPAPQLLAKKNREANADASAQKRALHALNRLTFGPRPGDLQQVMAMGVDGWIDRQLHPQKIDDGALNSRLAPFRTLRMSSEEIAENFPDPQEIHQVMKGKRPMPTDPALRAIYEVQLARHEARQQQKQEAAASAGNSTATLKDSAASEASSGAASAPGDPAAGNGTMADMGSVSPHEAGTGSSPAKVSPEEDTRSQLREEQLYADLDVQQLPGLPASERYQKILGLPVAELLSVAGALRGGKGREYLEGMTPLQKENLLALNYPGGVVEGELAEAKILRAVYSQRQLKEVMTDFWLNHFNVFAGKGLDRMMLTSYERDVIRPRALGKFEDLLVATAKSPAMLYYLDNWMSVGPNSPEALGRPLHPNPNFQPRPKPGKRPSGLNENYGRELLELHTLSVNGGYSQHDVTEAAKVFTGWTIDKPAQGGEFKFEPRMHEPGSKLVLGHRIKENGEGEGLELLHRLATSPKTAHFIALKLAERFVSDNPPPELVTQMAKTFLKKKGDIREVLTVLFHSPDFWNDNTYRAKVKTPLEFVASSIRATGAEIEDARPLLQQLNRMGMPLYGAQPPTGYSMKAEDWVSSSALLNRMNFALALTNGKIKGVDLPGARLAASDGPSDLSTILSRLESSLVAGGVSEQTHDSILAQIDSTNKNAPPKQDANARAFAPKDTQVAPEVGMMAGLLLGSPEFQRK
jgi:uncharacterized protein (DUF1800 family)